MVTGFKGRGEARDLRRLITADCAGGEDCGEDVEDDGNENNDEHGSNDGHEDVYAGGRDDNDVW